VAHNFFKKIYLILYLSFPYPSSHQRWLPYPRRLLTLAHSPSPENQKQKKKNISSRYLRQCESHWFNTDTTRSHGDDVVLGNWTVQAAFLISVFFSTRLSVPSLTVRRPNSGLAWLESLQP
jgi:hypothetical protein